MATKAKMSTGVKAAIIVGAVFLIGGGLYFAGSWYYNKKCNQMGCGASCPSMAQTYHSIYQWTCSRI